jgi:hypothetical protein
MSSSSNNTAEEEKTFEEKCKRYLPPLVSDKWSYEDINPLTLEELWTLHKIVWKKLNFIENQIENRTA